MNNCMNTRLMLEAPKRINLEEISSFLEQYNFKIGRSDPRDMGDTLIYPISGSGEKKKLLEAVKKENRAYVIWSNNRILMF